MRFVDTNVLLYAVSGVAASERKRERALGILDERDLGLSVQVLQEFYVQATRASRPDRLDPDDAWALVESFVVRYPVQETTVDLIRAAWVGSGRYRISYWDAAIIEAARLLGCAELLSEDLSHGQDYSGVKVVNPFL